MQLKSFLKTQFLKCGILVKSRLTHFLNTKTKKQKNQPNKKTLSPERPDNSPVVTQRAQLLSGDSLLPLPNLVFVTEAKNDGMYQPAEAA